MEDTTVTLTPWANDRDAAEAMGAEGLDVLEDFEALEIETQEDMEFAGEMLREVKTRLKAMKAMQDRVVKPLNTALKELRSWFKPPKETLEKCEHVLKTKIATAHDREFAAQQQMLEKAGAAAMSGNTEEAQALVQQASSASFEPVKGLSLRHTFDFEVEDLDDVPDDYFVLDEQKVLAVIRAAKGDIQIPGIKVVRNTGITARTG